MKEVKPDAAPDHPEGTEVECRSCGETVTVSEAVTHPAYKPEFCSYACRSRFMNKLP